MLDLIYFALGTMVEMGTLPQPLMDIVHYEGNMSKLHMIDGKPTIVKNEIGKVIKPADWVAPEPKLEQEVERQALQRPLSDIGA
jgi:predicted HAD superfamily Cof-like phosphohydrolase